MNGDSIKPLGGKALEIRRATGDTPYKRCATPDCIGEADLGRERCTACYANRGPILRVLQPDEIKRACGCVGRADWVCGHEATAAREQCKREDAAATAAGFNNADEYLDRMHPFAPAARGPAPDGVVMQGFLATNFAEQVPVALPAPREIDGVGAAFTVELSEETAELAKEMLEKHPTSSWSFTTTPADRAKFDAERAELKGKDVVTQLAAMFRHPMQPMDWRASRRAEMRMRPMQGSLMNSIPPASTRLPLSVRQAGSLADRMTNRMLDTVFFRETFARTVDEFLVEAEMSLARLALAAGYRPAVAVREALAGRVELSDEMATRLADAMMVVAQQMEIPW